MFMYIMKKKNSNTLLLILIIISVLFQMQLLIPMILIWLQELDIIWISIMQNHGDYLQQNIKMVIRQFLISLSQKIIPFWHQLQNNPYRFIKLMKMENGIQKMFQLNVTEMKFILLSLLITLPFLWVMIQLKFSNSLIGPKKKQSHLIKKSVKQSLSKMINFQLLELKMMVSRFIKLGHGIYSKLFLKILIIFLL